MRLIRQLKCLKFRFPIEMTVIKAVSFEFKTLWMVKQKFTLKLMVGLSHSFFTIHFNGENIILADLSLNKHIKTKQTSICMYIRMNVKRTTNWLTFVQ